MKPLFSFIGLILVNLANAQTDAIKADRLIIAKGQAPSNPTVIVRKGKIIDVNFNGSVTDVGSFPWNINEAKELEFLVKKAGLTPMDAIKAATINPAELLNKQTKLGQVKKDFIADIIAVKGNPLDDITLLQHVAFVMKDGKVVKEVGK